MKDFFARHGLRILLAAAALAVVICVLSYLSATSSLLRNAAGIVVSPFRAAFTAVENWVQDKRRYYADYTALAEENAALRRQIADMEEEVRRSKADREENALLRDLIGLREQRRDLVWESAYVLDRTSSNWTSSLTLNHGTDRGIAVQDCVVSAEGYLVGVVSEVGYNWCTVLTLIDTDTELGARIFRTDDIVVAEGDFSLMGEKRLKLSYLPTGTTLLGGDYVVTSGLGGYFPAGLAIGTVESVRADAGRDPYAVVAPLVDFDALSEVFVVTDFTVVD